MYEEKVQLTENDDAKGDITKLTEDSITEKSDREFDNEINTNISKQNQERLTDIIYQQFDGDRKKAIKHILFTYEYEELDKYVFEWNQEELEIAYLIVKNDSDKNMAKEEAEKIVTEYKSSAKEFWIRIIITTMVCVGGVFLLSLLKDKVSDFETCERYTMFGISIFITLQSLKIAPIIVDMFRYHIAKRKLINWQKAESEQ